MTHKSSSLLSPVLDKLNESLAKNTVISLEKTNGTKTSVEFVSIENIGIRNLTLNYKLTSFYDEILWDTRHLWEEYFLEYLNKKLANEFFFCLSITNLRISKGSLFFGFDIAVLSTITAFLGVVNGAIALANNITTFFKKWRENN